MKYINDTLEQCGIYVIRNLINNYIYIGSSIMLYKRYREHLTKLIHNKHHNKILQRSWNKYGSEGFVFEVVRTYNNIIDHDLRYIEGLLIRLFKSEYNICMFPEDNGKPNYMRKLDSDWIKKLHENNNYKHKNNPEIYQIVIQKNKKDASIVKIFNRDLEIFNGSIIDACRFVNIKKHDFKSLNIRCNVLKYKLECTKTQKKKVSVTEDKKEIIFNSAGECDRYYNLWRGCTSNCILKLNGNLFGKHARYV